MLLVFCKLFIFTEVMLSFILNLVLVTLGLRYRVSFYSSFHGIPPLATLMMGMKPSTRADLSKYVRSPRLVSQSSLQTLQSYGRRLQHVCTSCALWERSGRVTKFLLFNHSRGHTGNWRMIGCSSLTIFGQIKGPTQP